MRCSPQSQGYLGHSSTWSFSQQTLRLIEAHLNRADVSEIPSNVEGSAYNLDWEGWRSKDAPDITDLPSLDYAIFLVDTVKFHIGQMYHLYDEDDFMHDLYGFYDSPFEKARTARLWYIQFLLVLAFGMAFNAGGQEATAPPGSHLFARAMTMLPGTTHLYREPVASIEILCSISFYLQSADMRNLAYNYVRALPKGVVIFPNKNHC